MTTAPPRRPSPADLAARAQRKRDQAADRTLTATWTRQPGDLPFRAVWETGIRMSRSIPHPHRLVALTLATHADWETGLIPTAAQPRLDGLVTETLLTTPRVVVALHALMQRGWIRHVGRAQYETAVLRLEVPALLVPQLTRRATGETPGR
ncbi:hypothetical protein ACIOHE_15850 [Streptomyces sp. NPDC087851]|uniref:hypothetical protein n=1 Tax=Streptomyces sp. NPDC087851 TaxID=3365810 RepID=UPI00380E80B0